MMRICMKEAMRVAFAAGIVCTMTGWGIAAEDWSDGEKLFALHVKPLLAQKCLACHGADPDDIQGGLDLRSRTALLEGGDSFGQTVVTLGDGEESLLYRVTTREEAGFEMPPKESDQLTEQQTWWIRDWINAGAPWPEEDRVRMIQIEYAEGEQVATSEALSPQWQDRRYDSQSLWAYRPLASVNVPSDEHPVDWFINQRLADADVSPAGPAAAKEFARRLSFGLTGLPPDAERLEQFEAADAKDPRVAVKNLAGELMASPRYGEQFGLHWLDVVRYADSAGFANDFSRPNAWRYRDYVVRSFNEDKPFNDFVIQQIAGDELDPSDPENLIATGFLRMGPWEQTGMSVFRETRQQWLDDVTDTVGQAFLAHAMQCAKCHDHKFDPVPTRDYYQLMAVFSTTQFAERDAEFLVSENRIGFDQSDAWVNAKIAAYEEQQRELKQKINQLLKQETESAKVGDNGLDPGDEASTARIGKNILRHRWELDRTRPIALSVYTGNTIRRNNVANRLPLPKDPWAAGEMEADTILAGGSAYAPTDPVRPGPLSAAVSLAGMNGPEFPQDQGPRRLALANWIVDPTNPLTARVIVNRVWSWHFGKGLAENPNNFGTTGGMPTHPELLDYLAQWFMDHGWSIKKLNQLIVTSDAYRRGSRHPHPELLAMVDPKGELYTTFLPRRLTAEELRDAMLFASGELNTDLGGIPARPAINLEVAFQPRQIMGGAASVYEPDPLPEQRNRRSIYAEKLRGLRDPFLEIFNQPGPDKSCEVRETSTIAPQALTLINSEAVFDRAIGFAVRLRSEKLDQARTVRRAFRLALSRDPTDKELKICQRQWRDATGEEATRSPEYKTWSVTIERTVMAEKTGQPYSFDEYMPAYAEYRPDTQAADVDARTRGLAHVCLVLFNLNEFAYLD